MPRQELESLLSSQAMKPEQDILLNWFYATFDRLPAGGGNRHIVNVEPFYYQGAIAGHECLTYAATKLYILFDGYFVRSDGYGAIASNQRINFYNEADALFLYTWNNFVSWNATTVAHNYVSNPHIINNIYFSRFTINDVSHMRLIGYRVTLN